MQDYGNTGLFPLWFERALIRSQGEDISLGMKWFLLSIFLLKMFLHRWPPLGNWSSHCAYLPVFHLLTSPSPSSPSSICQWKRCRSWMLNGDAKTLQGSEEQGMTGSLFGVQVSKQRGGMNRWKQWNNKLPKTKGKNLYMAEFMCVCVEARACERESLHTLECTVESGKCCFWPPLGSEKTTAVKLLPEREREREHLHLFDLCQLPPFGYPACLALLKWGI